MGRRRFIGWLGAAAGGLAGMGSVSSLTMGATEIPIPHYIPEGYFLLGEYRGVVDGFRTGESEIKLAYMSPKVNRRGIFGPLFIFVSPMTDNFFGGTQGAKPEVMQLRIGDLTVEARYFDGTWYRAPNGGTTLPNGTRVTWNTSNLNSLVFPFDGFMIAIRGSKQAGVGRTELIKIASSMEWNMLSGSTGSAVVQATLLVRFTLSCVLLFAAIMKWRLRDDFAFLLDGWRRFWFLKSAFSEAEWGYSGAKKRIMNSEWWRMKRQPRTAAMAAKDRAE
jgi:hypothetical protein